MISKVLPAGEFLLNGGRLPGQADLAPYGGGLPDDVAPFHQGAAPCPGAAAW